MTTYYDQQKIAALSSDLNNWQPVTKIPEAYPQFTPSTVKRLFWQREKHAGLSTCYRRVGKKGYVNIPLFGLFLAGLLPQQQGGEHE